MELIIDLTREIKYFFTSPEVILCLKFLLPCFTIFSFYLSFTEDDGSGLGIFGLLMVKFFKKLH